jgi:hypothetical protein
MKQLFSILSVVLILSACDKPDFPDPSPGQTGLKLVLRGQYLPGTNIDSAFAIWNMNGQKKSVKLTVKNDTLTTRLDTLTTGAGQMTIQLFTKNKLDNKSLQFERSFPLFIGQHNTVTVTGPQSLNDNNWKPRIIFNYRGQSSFNVTAIVALRPADPYFELKAIDPEWRDRIIIERSYYQQGTPATKIAGGTWDCNDSCTDTHGNYINTSFFSFLPEQVNNRDWNRVEFLVRFYKNAAEASEMNFDYNF